MQEILFVGLGGFVGSVARYKLGGLVLHHALDWRFPISTFTVNVVGCLLAGVFAGLVERHGLFSPLVRTCLLTGLIGGFTTFSAFSLETVFLLRRGEVGVAFAYVALSIICGFAALWIAMKVVPS